MITTQTRPHLGEECDRHLARRADKLLKTEIQFVASDEFYGEESEREILKSDELSAEPAKTRVPKDLPAHLARFCDTELLSAKQERDLFRQMNYLKFRANSIRSTLDPQRPNQRAIEKVESYLEDARAIRDHIVSANTRLVISVVKKFVSPQLSFDEVMCDGISTLLKCVDKFDYDRGFRFSTYAYRSICRTSFRLSTDRRRENGRYVSIDDSDIDVADERKYSSTCDSTWIVLRDLLSGMLQKLDRREQFVIHGRYALGDVRQKRTFQSLADEMGVSKERARQLTQRAVTKLQKMAAESNLGEICELAGV